MSSSKILNQVIMGTAGHVDHGKTTLIKALTGIDCDTHEAEKKRGITINLGFAHLCSQDNYTKIGIVDVPGHKDFIKTMISGVSALDFVLMIIAADSSIMPQTLEHLRILEILGTKQGIIVLTKTDLVDPLLIELAIEEIKDFTKGTFLESTPIIQVSAKKNININILKEHIFNTAAKCIKGKKANTSQLSSPFRMYIDDNCTDCMTCTSSCKYQALEEENILNRKPGLTCTMCGDCITSCQTNSIKYKFFKMSPERARNLYLIITISVYIVFLNVARI